MRLAELAAVARRRADSLDRDAMHWHRLACKAREMLKSRREAARQQEARLTVAIPAEVDPGEPIEDETE